MGDEQKNAVDADEILQARAVAHAKAWFLGYGLVQNEEPCITQLINPRDLDLAKVNQLVPRIRSNPRRYDYPLIYFAQKSTVKNLRKSRDIVRMDEAGTYFLEFTEPPVRVGGNHRVEANKVLRKEGELAVLEYEGIMDKDLASEAERKEMLDIKKSRAIEARAWLVEVYDIGT